MTSQRVDTAQPPAIRILYTACPLCAASDMPSILTADCSAHPLYHPSLPRTIVWRRCRRCGHVFTEGYFTEEAAAIVFSKSLPHQTVGHDAERTRAVSARMVERVARHVMNGDWLDIGFGNGSLLFTAAEWGFRPVGADLRQDNVATLRKLGFEAHADPIERLQDSGRFSVISMADVLEHMPQPRLGLEAAWRLLRPGGVVLLSMPNMDCIIWRMLDAAKTNPYWGEIEHYHNFGRSRLYDLLREFGFDPVEYGISERYRVCMEVIARKP
jgi:protein O-GlcNAc transferase